MARAVQKRRGVCRSFPALAAAAVLLVAAAARAQAETDPVDPGEEPSASDGGLALSPARDDSAEGALTATGASLQPPQLLSAVQASYPSGVVAPRETDVVLRLTVSAEGRVLAAEVVEPNDTLFDEAARAAALAFQFSPALRDGVPVQARILYRYTFRPPLEARAPVSEPDAGASLPIAPEARAPTPVAGTVMPQAVEVTVRGKSAADRLRRSAQAVQVIGTTRARRESADLGEVLARSQGIGIRRGGGLGSTSQFSLNGLSGDQVRFFLDGVPLEVAGYPFGIANVPVNLVERVEVYRGIVPVRFGADALGGAVNLVTQRALSGTHGAASYQLGSFETHRATLRASHAHEPSGWFVEGAGFVDRAENNYQVDVEVPDERGRPLPVQVRRFHDAYQAASANVTTGAVSRPWANQLILRGFVTAYEKELQNNLTMEQVYGDARYGEQVAGTNLRFQNDYARRMSVDMLAGYARTWRKFVDTGRCAYSWYGECADQRANRGEVEGVAHDQRFRDHTAFARMSVVYQPHHAHELRLSLSPSYSSRSGEEREGLVANAPDPLAAERNLLTWVSGIEYTSRWNGALLENVLFFKDYLQLQASEQVLPGGEFVRAPRTTHRNGVGNALRYAFTSELTAKLSYEWATRLPRPDELFGDGVRTSANLELVPETSHNANLGLALADAPTPLGLLRFDANGFMRAADDLIEPLRVNPQQIAYQNVVSARSLGIEASAGWTSPGNYLALDGNVTYQDFRNTSSSGVQAPFKGDRIPNVPYLFGSGTARAQLHDVAVARDELSFSWVTRYVHEFYRSWESAGTAGVAKDFTPRQLTHSAALTYLLRASPASLSFAIEVQNLTDAQVFDFYGIQRPGRAAFCKVTAEL